MLEAWAEYYSADLKKKIHRGLRESVSKGIYPGPVPYGYSKVDRRIVINEKEAPILREIFSRVAAG